MTEPAPDKIPTAAPAPEEDKQVAALIEKYKPEINQAHELDSAHQQELFRVLGVDPKALEAHYADLQRRDDELRRRDRSASNKVLAATWGSFGAGAGGVAVLTAKSNLSKLVRGVGIALSGMAAALAGSFVASRVLSGKTREESKQLDGEARKAFDRELAIALENRSREDSLPVAPAQPAAAQPVEQTPAAPAQAPVTQTVTASVPKREASFAAQANAEKAATINITIRA